MNTEPGVDQDGTIKNDIGIVLKWYLIQQIQP